MRAALPPVAIAALLAMAHAKAQTPYPDLTIQDVAWSSGTHHTAVTQKIVSPFTPDLPVDIGGTADAEFVSGSEVRLRPGFHAGGFANNNAGFRAYIDPALGPPGDVIIISPNIAGNDPYGGIADNVIHVHKWEKVEVGLRLPQEYQDAIDRFFAHYYPFPDDPLDPDDYADHISAPGNTDALHDLNPYADDSLQLVMTLTRPDGSQTMKWGFWMREARWDPSSANADQALLELYPSSALDAYNVRFRFAPDKEGAWKFRIALEAPDTHDLTNTPLPSILYSGYSFICSEPLPGNRGHLQINESTNRTLQFQGDDPNSGDEEHFLALGVNLGHHRIDPTPGYHPFKLHRRDLDLMMDGMARLHTVGGNFARVFLLNYTFAPEWVNLGVFDAYKTPEVCDMAYQSICGNGGWFTGINGNCQSHCWAFDQLLNSAHDNGIYIQLCIDPNPAVIDYQRFLWGANPYVLEYVEPYRDTPVNGNPWDLKRMLYSNLDPEDVESPRLYDEGVFYFWKRKYKYIMSRWGWSVNVPIIEPFNEIDQMLSYSTRDCSPDMTADDPCSNNGALCQENRVPWVEDAPLHTAVSDWFSDIANYVRGDVDWGDPGRSPLGDKHKLFLASYAGAEPGQTNAATYYAPFLNPDVDLIDAHKGLHNPWDLRDFNSSVEDYRTLLAQKPFNSGEFTHYTKRNYSGKEYDLSPFFHNYEIAFHDELWSSAFSGKFAAGTSWQWGRVFWWPDSQKPAPPDAGNNFQSNHPEYQFDNRPNEWNRLFVDNGNYWVQNKTVYHNFKPLTDLLNHPSWTAYDFFSGEYKPKQNEDFTDFEAYYLQNGAPNETATLAIGWVRNRNASIFNSYYLASSEQQFFNCTPPNPSTSAYLNLPGFEPGDYYLTWFPTRLNSTVHPPDGQVSTSFSGTIALNLQNQFGGIANDYLDTLRSDYAFIITPEPFVKGLRLPQVVEGEPTDLRWDFTIYPNPAHDVFRLNFHNDAPKEVSILDVSGRLVASYSGVTGTTIQLPQTRLPQGAYWVRVSDGRHRRTKKLIMY